MIHIWPNNRNKVLYIRYKTNIIRNLDKNSDKIKSSVSTGNPVRTTIFWPEFDENKLKDPEIVQTSSLI